MLKAVIFDLDGVLVDSEPLMRYAFERAYRHVIGEGHPPIERYLEHMGESFPHIMRHLGLPLTLWEPYRRLCQENLDRVKVFAGSRALLERLGSLGLRLAVLTGKDRARALQTMEHGDLLGYFDEVVASDQLQHPKPHPEGIFRALRSLDCAPHEAVMIGDAVSDILCAERAGVLSVAVTWGIKPERVQTLCQPDFIVHDWEALTDTLLGLRDSMAVASAHLNLVSEEIPALMAEAALHPES